MSDLLDVVEAAYAQVEDPTAWLSGVVSAASPHLAHEWGTAGWHSDAAFNCLTYAVVDLPSEGGDPYWEGHLRVGQAQQARLIPGLRGGDAITSAVTYLGAPTEAQDPIHMREVVFPRGARDVLVVMADTVQDEYLGLCALRREQWHSSERQRQVWNRVATHIGAGLRLRSRPAPGETTVVAPSGKVEHAIGEARDPLALEAIRGAVRKSEKARGRLRRDNPAQALQLWKGLVSGRWSLVDHFDSDGRRYILARENAPEPHGPKQLSSRQRTVIKLRARGASLKLISYELGLSVGTVSVELREALRVLGVRSALELGALLSPASNKGDGRDE